MNKKTLRRLWIYIKQYRIYVIITLILSICIVAATLYVPKVIGQAIDCIISKGKVDFDTIYDKLLLIVALVISTALLQWFMNTVNNKIAYGIVRDMRNDAFEKIERLPISALDKKQTGDVVSRVISDVDTFSDGLLMGFSQAFTGVMTIAGTFIFMLGINIKISIIVVCMTPLSLLVANFIAKKTYSMFLLQSATRGEQTAHIEEMIGNEKVVKAFGHELEACEKFDEINERLGRYSLRAIFFSSLTNPCTRFVNSTIYAIVALFGAYGVMGGRLSVGGLSCLLSYANQYTKPFNEISSVITELQNAFACAGRILELIDEEAEMPDLKNACVLDLAEGNVAFDEVSFSYTKDRELLRGINFSVKKGERVAIVGPTGCGKTTLINLLMRFYDVDSGRILVDDKDTKNITRESLRENFGMVLQDTWLSSGTIKDNIIMGKQDATEEEIVKACKEAHCHNFIRRLPKGYDTYIGEDGGNLSNGQKQLLCIARLMLCKPPMLILDEATSSIDTRTELKIQEAFVKLMEGRTSFIVAHRLSTIIEADLILVMKDGNIIEQGNHQTLLKDNGFYAKLFKAQWN